MRSYLMLYSTDFDGDDDRPGTFKSGKSRISAGRAYTVLSSVNWCWWRALSGWPESPTRLWLKHKVKKLVERECIFT